LSVAGPIRFEIKDPSHHPDPVPAGPPPPRSYLFSAPQLELEPTFSLSFPSPVTVAVVRTEIANRIKHNRGDIQLLFGGRLLRDPLVLDNVQIKEDDPIVVHVKKLTQLWFE
jgi:hypothetical protein